MKKHFIFLLTGFITLLLSAYTFYPLMEKGADFTLYDFDKNKHTLSEYSESEAIVLIFVSTQCPVSNAYNERMGNIYNDYKEKGITFLGINSNKAEDVEEIRNHAKKNKLGFPVLKDEKNKVADLYEATVTPEVFVLDGDLNILYHGRIDDNQRESSVKEHDLRTTLDQILADQKITNSRTKAFGCTIKRI